MSVSATVFCHDCRQVAPRIGAAGSVGFPSLADSAEERQGLNSFGYLASGFQAIGYQPWQLGAIAAYLTAHMGHDVALYLEGEEVAEMGAAPRLALDLSDATTFTFAESGFVMAIYEVTCKKCGESFRNGPTLLRPIPRKTLSLTSDRIQLFLDRVREADETNFHNLSGLLDYHGAQEALATFLSDHQKHRPVATIVQEEEWRAAAGVQPWRLAWSRADPLPFDGEPVVLGDRIFVATANTPLGPRNLTPAVTCVDMSGQLLWHRELSSLIANIRAHRDGILVQCFHPGRPVSLELVQLHADTGEIAWAKPSPFRILDLKPGDDAFVGCQSTYADSPTDTLALVDLPTLEARWQFARSAEVYDRLGLALANADAVFAIYGSGRTPASVICFDRATGARRWSTSLAEYGERILRGQDFLLWGEFVIAHAGTKLIALNVDDGSATWTLDVPLSYWYESRNLMFGMRYGGFGAVDLEARSLRILSDPSAFMKAPPPLPTFESWAGRSIVVGDEILMVNQSGRRLWGLEAATGQPRWMHSPPGGVTGLFPVLADGRFIVQGPGLCCYVRGNT